MEKVKEKPPGDKGTGGIECDGEGKMKVVDREAFKRLPAGTAFQRGKPWRWSGLRFKQESYADDWRYIEIDSVEADNTGELVDRFSGVSYQIEDGSIRDGRFDPDDLFLIYEVEDLARIRGWIDEAIAASNKKAPDVSAEGSD